MSLSSAKHLRTRMTDAELRLWYFLRAHRFSGFKFKRQAPVGPYVVDFVCFERSLIIEVDGGQHLIRASDQLRDQWFGKEGFRVLRFWNNDVLKETNAVLSVISDALTSPLTPLPARSARHPLPQGERGS